MAGSFSYCSANIGSSHRLTQSSRENALLIISVQSNNAAINRLGQITRLAHHYAICRATARHWQDAIAMAWIGVRHFAAVPVNLYIWSLFSLFFKSRAQWTERRTHRHKHIKSPIVNHLNNLMMAYYTRWNNYMQPLASAQLFRPAPYRLAIGTMPNPRLASSCLLCFFSFLLLFY